MSTKEELRGNFIIMTENYKSKKVNEHSRIIEKVLQIENEKVLILLDNLSGEYIKKATQVE